MQTASPKPTKPKAPQPWDFVGIIRFQGRDGLRRRYQALAPFAHLLLLYGDKELLMPRRWYRSPQLCSSLAMLQAQWEDLRKPDALPWVACRFWAQDLSGLRESCKGAGTESDPVPKPRGFVMPNSLSEYLASDEFDKVCLGLERIDEEEQRYPYPGVAA